MVYYYGFPQNAIKIHDSTVMQNIADGADRVVTKRDNLEKAIAIETLPSEYWPSMYDRGAFGRDETWMQFVEWRMACELDQTIEYVETRPTEIFLIPTKGVEVFYNKGGLKMAYAEGSYDFRDTAILAYKAYLLEEHARDFMRSAEGEEFAIKHGDLLSKAPNIDYIIIGKEPDGIYGVAEICEHSAIFFGNWDSYKMMEDWAKREGVPVNDFIRRGMGEEFAHLASRGGRSVEEEVKVREWLIDVYMELANKSINDKTKEGYQQIVRHLERDLATVPERYREAYSQNLRNLVKMYHSDRTKLELVLESEAILEEGLEGRAVKEYVASRLEEIADADDDYEGSNPDGVEVDGELAEVCAEAESEGGGACEGGDGGGAEGEG